MKNARADRVGKLSGMRVFTSKPYNFELVSVIAAQSNSFATPPAGNPGSVAVISVESVVVRARNSAAPLRNSKP